MSNSLREELTRRSEDLQRLGHINDPVLQKMSSEVQSYHSFCPIDTKSAAPSLIYGYRTSLYKAIKSLDGGYYLLRRVEGISYIY